MTGRTKTAVKAKLRQLRQELDNGVRSSATYTVGNALDDWLIGGLSELGGDLRRAHVGRQLAQHAGLALSERFGRPGRLAR